MLVSLILLFASSKVSSNQKTKTVFGSFFHRSSKPFHFASLFIQIMSLTLVSAFLFFEKLNMKAKIEIATETLNHRDYFSSVFLRFSGNKRRKLRILSELSHVPSPCKKDLLISRCNLLNFCSRKAPGLNFFYFFFRLVAFFLCYNCCRRLHRCCRSSKNSIWIFIIERHS